MQALRNGAVLARATKRRSSTDGFFPPYSIDYRHFRASDTHTTRGFANYYHLDVGGDRLVDSAWFYPPPFDIEEITSDIAFAPEVQIAETSPEAPSAAVPCVDLLVRDPFLRENFSPPFPRIR